LPFMVELQHIGRRDQTETTETPASAAS
jgi:hypothetical protein